MNRRALTLLEVLVGLALLAGLGVVLLKIQRQSLRQYRLTQEQARVAERVERLLWEWSSAKAPVTLPANGVFDERHAWRREVRPVRVAADVLPTQISVIVTQTEQGQPPRDVYRVDWLVPEPETKGRP